MIATVGLIVDIVDSRKAGRRVEVQRAVRETFRAADAIFRPQQALWPTVGDEFQARYGDLATALAVTALVRLELLDTFDCRFGVGVGNVTVVEELGEAGNAIEDGSAWWRARDAITTVRKLQDTSQPSARTWMVGDDPRLTAAINALLLQRDSAVSRMKARERRLTAGLLRGRTQTELAREEQITQPAVSQALHRSGGAALVAGNDLLAKANL